MLLWLWNTYVTAARTMELETKLLWNLKKFKSNENDEKRECFFFFSKMLANFIWLINMNPVCTILKRVLDLVSSFSATILNVLKFLGFVWKCINPAWQRHQFIGWNAYPPLFCFTNCTFLKTTCCFQMHFCLVAGFSRTRYWIEKKI